MIEEKKTIRFLKPHGETIGKTQVRFRTDDICPVGGSHQISEELGRDLIRRGVAVPADSHGAAMPFSVPGR